MKPCILLTLINYRRPADGQPQSEQAIYLPNHPGTFADARRYGQQCMLAKVCTGYRIEVADM